MSKVGGSAATAMQSSTTFKVSVLRCRTTKQVLFVEAGKDFVDTLFTFLLLPVGTIIHMLSNGVIQVKPLGGISSIFKSVEKLDCSFLHVDKKQLVEPRPAVAGTCGSAGLLPNLEAALMKISSSRKGIELPAVYYRCNRSGCSIISSTKGAACSVCSKSYFDHHYFNIAVALLPDDLQSLKARVIEKLDDEDPVHQATCSTSRGFVRENITYLVTDNLEVMPSTTIKSIKVLNQLKVATLADLESSDITVSITQILELLQSAMTSNNCLNEVFGKK